MTRTGLKVHGHKVLERPMFRASAFVYQHHTEPPPEGKVYLPRIHADCWAHTAEEVGAFVRRIVSEIEESGEARFYVSKNGIDSDLIAVEDMLERG